MIEKVTDLGPTEITDITAARHEVPSIHTLAPLCFRT